MQDNQSYENLMPSLPMYENSEEANVEMLTLAGVISHPHLLSTARRIAKARMFSNAECQKIWNTLIAMEDGREPVNVTSLLHKTDNKNFVKKLVTKVVEAPSTDLEMVNFCSMLKDNFIKRSCYMTGIELIRKSLTSGTTEESFVASSNELQTILADTTTRQEKNQSLNEVLAELGKTLERQQKEKAEGKVLRVTSGISQLDYTLYSGFAPGDLVILAARPSVGKTAVMLQMAKAGANAGKKPVLFNLEMTNAGLAQRILTSTSYVSQHDIAKADINWKDFNRAVNQFRNTSMLMNDYARYLDEIVANLTVLVKQGRCGVAYIDYLGLIDIRENKATPQQRIEQITKRLKQLAKELNIPIILLCQLNRSSAYDSRPPMLTDLRDSGSIEQDADTVLMLEAATEEKLRDAIGDDAVNYNAEEIILMWIRKNRQGQKDFSIPLKRNKNYTVFTPLGEEEKVSEDVFQNSTEDFEDDDLPF